MPCDVWDEGDNAKCRARPSRKAEEVSIRRSLHCRNANGDRQSCHCGRPARSSGVRYPYQNHAAWSRSRHQRSTRLTSARSGPAPRMRACFHASFRPPPARQIAMSTSVCSAAASAVAPRRLCPAGGSGRQQMPGTPSNCCGSREEDMTHGRYHPVTQCKLTGGIDADTI